MLKLMKYEFRKTLFSKYVILIFTLLSEILFIYGVLANKEELYVWGIIALMMCAMIGMFFIGIESILVMQQDLNTKQSYMLFLTPHSSYEILGAKILQNGLAVFIAGVLFGILAVADISFLIIRMEGLKAMLDFVNMALAQINMDIHITRTEGFLGLFASLSSWLNMIVNGYLAVVLSATLFAGKKLSHLLSFLIYVVLVFLEGKLLSFLPEMSGLSMELAMMIASNLLLIGLIYLFTGWIMEQKLNV